MNLTTRENIYSYYISNQMKEFPLLRRTVVFGNYYFMCDERTDVLTAKHLDREILVFGDIVNVVSGRDNEIAEYLLDNSSSLRELIQLEFECGGQYLILYREKEEYYLLGDATTSLPIFYIIDSKKQAASSYEGLLARNEGYTPDSELMKIRQASDYSQPMPSDITVYNQVKALLPNHYLNLTTNSVERIVATCNEKTRLNPNEAAMKIDTMVTNLARYYCRKYPICCPLTGGHDSRVVLAYLRKINPQIKSFTIRHKTMSNQDSDITIPKEIAQKTGLNYTVIEDEIANEETVALINEVYYLTPYSKRTVDYAVTVKLFCKGDAISNGDTIGQIGQSALHRNIPVSLASARYFRCKIHNSRRECLKYIAEWIKDAEYSHEKESLFDLFSIESRLGRWTIQSRQIYNLIGQRIVNIFNSRSIIFCMTRVSREERMKCSLHDELLRNQTPEFVNFSYVQDGFLERISKKNGFTFYIGTMSKYYIKKIQRGKKSSE